MKQLLVSLITALALATTACQPTPTPQTTTTSTTSSTTTPPPSTSTSTVPETSIPDPTTIPENTTTTEAPTTTTSTTEPPEPSNVAEKISNITYGKRTLDLYLPVGSEPHPLVVWAHGGFWSSGAKHQIPTSLVEFVAGQGYAVASINYRLAGAPNWFGPPLQYPTNPSPAQVHDFKTAVRYLQDNADDWNLDPSTTIVSGFSSGGHLALLTAMSNYGDATGGGNLQIPGDQPSISAVVGFGTPADLTLAMGSTGPIGEVAVRGLMGCLIAGACYPYAADPGRYLDADDVPVMLVSGGDDILVPTSHAASFQRTASSVGFEDLTTRTEPGIIHDLIGSRFNTEAVADWMESIEPSQ